MAGITINPSGQTLEVSTTGKPMLLYDEYAFMAERYLSRLTDVAVKDAEAVRGLSLAWDDSIRDKITAAYPLLGSTVAQKTFNMVNPGLRADSCRAATLNCSNNAYGITIPQGPVLQGWFNTNIPMYSVVQQFHNGMTFYIKDNIAGAGDWLIAGLNRSLDNLSNRWAYHPTSGGSNLDYVCQMSEGVVTNTSAYSPGLMSVWSEVGEGTHTISIRSNGITRTYSAGIDFYGDYIYLDKWASLAFFSRANAAYTLRFAVHHQGLTETQIINKIEKPVMDFLNKTGKI